MQTSYFADSANQATYGFLQILYFKMENDPRYKVSLTEFLFSMIIATHTGLSHINLPGRHGDTHLTGLSTAPTHIRAITSTASECCLQRQTK